MGFGDAISAGFQKFVVFSGRASRAEYWYWALFSVLVILAFTFVDIVVFGVSTGPLSTLATLALILPGLAATARRLHDTGRYAWWLLLPIGPLVGLIVAALVGYTLLMVIAVAAALIGFVILLLMAAAPGTTEPNRFGPEPP